MRQMYVDGYKKPVTIFHKKRVTEHDIDQSWYLNTYIDLVNSNFADKQKNGFLLRKLISSNIYSAQQCILLDIENGFHWP